MTSLTGKIRAGRDLNPGDVQEALALLLSDSVAAQDKADFLTELHRKGETANEIAAFVRVLLDRAIPLEIDEREVSGPVIDVCGTGGDGISLFNVSTAVMFVLAAGGATVVKHGNRNVTSRSGSADVLEALGVPIDLGPDDLRECVKRLGLGFAYARTYHPAFRALAEMRRELAGKNQRTIFNLLGPLLNPMRPKRQLIGVFTPRLTMTFAEVMRQLGRERAWVVNGMAGDGQRMDDVSTIGPTTIAELRAGKVTSAVLDTRWLGIAQAKLDELLGGEAKSNAEIITAILSGKETGPRRDLVIVNAAAGFVVAGCAREMNMGIAMAREQIECGRAMEKLRALQHYQR
jgi:anthranilate phosphoribosyltransferase